MTHTRFKALALLAVVTCSTSSRASAQLLIDPVQTTGISGYRGTRVTWLASGEYSDGLAGLSWVETADKPCGMTVIARALDSGNNSNGGRNMNICGPSIDYPNPAAVFLEMADGGPAQVRFNANTRLFIRGIAACSNNSSNHRLKGVRIYPASVAPNTWAVSNLSSNEVVARTNCSTWHAPVYCAAYHVAAAVVVYHTEDEIVGLALRCKRIR